MDWYRRQVGSIYLVEVIFALAIAILLSVLLYWMYGNYLEAQSKTSERLTIRIMDSIEPLQLKHKEQNGQFASGEFNNTTGINTISNRINWKPSIEDSNHYSIQMLGEAAFKATAITPYGKTICRLYPIKVPC